MRGAGYTVDLSSSSPSVLRQHVQVEVAPGSQLGSDSPPPLSLSASTSLVGTHQHSNIATAVAALCRLRAMGWRIGDADMQAGIQRACLPARFQV